MIPSHVADAERMRKWLLNSWRQEFISVRAAAQRGPFKLTERTRDALCLLARYGWLIETPGEVVQGRPAKEAWRIIREGVG